MCMFLMPREFIRVLEGLGTALLTTHTALLDIPLQASIIVLATVDILAAMT